MLEKIEKPSPAELDIIYPIKSIYENLESEYPNLYTNIGVKKDISKAPIILLTGMSGSGKDSVLEPLLESSEAHHIVTATSRPRRIADNEPEGAYIWMRDQLESETRGEYLEYLKEEYRLIESDDHYGNVYGLPFMSLMKDGVGIPILRVDINGIINLNKLLPLYRFQPISVGVLPDSWTQVYDAILGRGCEDEDEAKERLYEDFNNIEMYVKNANYFIHNSRVSDIDGCCGLDISVEALRFLVKKFA
ncbi:hypothetical protein A3K02_02495 [candidate division WS6 bacterium RIFOXYD1_FULL_33_8]|uniref:Guanylate kinase-like domain-containing protein n=2 Tax=Candidatus Dojkabacteria TaxID=74243 RepID=A0A0G0DI26_9BACT|nr:MAG: hypothetical protein UR32_C0013G0014 [candidate division WS6 bacterium GW2011_GWE2_33_157]KKP43799.1 MAG: hypothetical protein UR34_C0011G0053 [candidate division WS6 bacterium GW2011_GWC1_33_20]KKP44848.1 MAG: hypothetical protein UR36_C0013G0016 [candidate division WS6 bacterium GW2011_GWF1_33_233]KKP54430.1 MAG: hypothetical protein UR45_C0015G0002 [candidate division WS6 bacterium GW2011_WS6_33_547]KKP55022.1 MAG: hypothetical protein UR47_C0006G0015 [candidate division WS6 bacteriu